MRANKTPQDYHEWSAAYPYLRRCKICVGKAKKTEQDYHDLAQAHGLEWLGPEVVSAHTKTWWRCKNRHEWEAGYNRLRGCPRCFESKGELTITSVLKVLDIHVIPQQSFETCRYKQPLRFDFYIPTCNLLIEYQGEGHFMTIWGKDQLRNTQRNDKIKADWAQQNGFELLPINYWEYERIAEILADKLQGYATSEYYKQGRLI